MKLTAGHGQRPDAKANARRVATGAHGRMTPHDCMAPTAGYVKLAQAPQVDFRGKIVLDIGSSTGGFTAYALEKGAARVIAVEKGTRQMMAPLRYDPRVELHEKTDVFDVVAGGSGDSAASSSVIVNGGVGVSTDAVGENGTRVSVEVMGKDATASDSRVMVPYPDVIVADVSFTSLTKVLMYARMKLARSDTEFLVMLKPQFEARPEQLNKGVVKNEKMRREIIHNFEMWLKKHGFVTIEKRDNELKGKNGNRERFYLLKFSS